MLMYIQFNKLQIKCNTFSNVFTVLRSFTIEVKNSDGLNCDFAIWLKQYIEHYIGEMMIMIMMMMMFACICLPPSGDRNLYLWHVKSPESQKVIIKIV